MHPKVQNLLPKPRLILQADEKNILLCQDARPLFCFEFEGDGPVFEQACALLQASLTEKGCLLAAQGAYPIRVRVDSGCAELAEHAKADAYVLSVGEDAAELTGYDEGGVFYAVQTFLQLVFEEDHCLYAPQTRICDWPAFQTRGLFIEDRYGSDFLTKEDWLRAVDYFAQMKLNTLTVGVYGCWCQQFDGMLSEYLYIPFPKHPELRTPRHVKYYSVDQRKWIYQENVLPVMFEQDYLSDVIAYAKKRSITVKPLFNSYGHNTLIPRMFPELSAKDEQGNDTGFGVCTADERTYEIMFDLYDEIIDRYLTPNGIDAMQIGLDEVWAGIGMDAEDPFKYHTPFCRCEKCRDRERSELMLEYIIRLCRHLKDKGMHSIYIYQDMLQYEFKVLDEKLAQRLKDEDLYDVVVIDWWDYSHESKLFRGLPLNSCFRSIIKSFTGYYHWSAPLEYLSNIRGCARLAQQHGFEGMEAYSSLEYAHDRSYRYMAELAWNPDVLEDQEDFLRRYAANIFPGAGEQARKALGLMAEVMDALQQDEKLGARDLFRQDYYMYTYVKKEEPYPRRFPEEVFRVIHDDMQRWSEGLPRIKSMAEEAAAFFAQQCENGMGNRMLARTWYAMALHYVTVTAEYMELLALEKETDSRTAVRRLEQLLAAREKLMYTVEKTRIPANQLMYLRIQSIYRQILVDLLVYAQKCAAEGRAFRLDMSDLTGITGDALRKLR